jgi:hypothetical protein
MRITMLAALFSCFVVPAFAGNVADAGEQKCLELTHIVSNSMNLSSDDKRYCSAFGQYIESQGINSTEGLGPIKDGMGPLIIATVANYVREHPQTASECTAQRTMAAMAYLFSGGQ